MNVRHTIDYEAGLALGRVGRNDEAALLFNRVIKADPNHASALNSLGVLDFKQGRTAEALVWYQRALKANPRHAEAWCNLGAALEAAGAHIEADKAFNISLALKPGLHEAVANLGIVKRELGDFAASEALYKAALELPAGATDAAAGRVFGADVDPRSTREERLVAKRKWYELARLPARTEWPNDRNPDRKLRVGYVSADYRIHSAAFAWGALPLYHDRTAFEVVCYSDCPVVDPMTTMFQKVADRWVDIQQVSDRDFVGMVERDQIDVLVDLGGHTGRNRMISFTAKPAPVQVHLTGYLAGTGVPEIDYIMLDEVIAPDDAEFIEKVWRLPCAFSYRPPDGCFGVAPAPVVQNGYLTFGYFGRWSKVERACVDLWAEILRAVPTARMIIKDKRFASEQQQEIVRAMFGDVGGRLEFQGVSGHLLHLKAHEQIDLGLDPFPQNGGVSTLESLWMGVPVLTMLGERPHARIAGSLLTAVGLTGFIARDRADYLALARSWAAWEPERWACLRSNMRARMQASVVGDHARWVAHVEAAYRAMWRGWCNG